MATPGIEPGACGVYGLLLRVGLGRRVDGVTDHPLFSTVAVFTWRADPPLRLFVGEANVVLYLTHLLIAFPDLSSYESYMSTSSPPAFPMPEGHAISELVDRG